MLVDSENKRPLAGNTDAAVEHVDKKIAHHQQYAASVVTTTDESEDSY
jgi:hypothetical protein